MPNLQNQTVVIVGGSSGIGFGVALAALQEQATVVIIASSSKERVDKAVARLKAFNLPGEVRGETLDAKDAQSIKDFADRIGTVDHVAWTSGDTPDGLLGGNGASAALIAGAFSVRFWGPFILAQSAKVNPNGSFTLTSGTLDVKPMKERSVTAGVCSALDGLTKGLAVDLAPLRVNVIGPGAIKTELWDGFTPEALAGFEAKVASGLLIKRMGTPSETAEAYMFVMKCGYITGQRINVDGGVALA